MRAGESRHDEQLSLRQRTLGHAKGSPGGCHPGPGLVHPIIRGDHHVVPNAFLSQRAVELYAFPTPAPTMHFPWMIETDRIHRHFSHGSFRHPLNNSVNSTAVLVHHKLAV